MMLFSDPSFLDGVGQVLVVVGLVGLVSLVFLPADRRVQRRALAALFLVVAAGGGGLLWRADKVRKADRDLTPAQQAALARAIGQFPAFRFEVLTSGADKEAHALALKVVDAVKAATGAVPRFDEGLQSPQKGVGLVVRANDVEPARTTVSTIGRAFMAARIAVISDFTPELDDRTVRIVVGDKP